jgi:L-asparaginase
VRRVVILHTGGTIGMPPRVTPTEGDRGSTRPPLAPDRFARELVAEVPELGRLAHIETRILCNLDSSDIGPDEWNALAEEVGAARERADGVVIVHGTDTMAYTAAALSFALVGLDRPVVMTGSQRPLGEVRTDARRNLVDAVDLATRDLPEVGVCFDGRFLRGNRATKGDAWSYSAFGSPNCPPLARLGLDVEIAPHVRRPEGPFRCEPGFDPRVAVLYVTPGMDPAMPWRLVDRGELRGLVIAAFGTGNVPLRVNSLVPALRQAVEAGVTVLVVTQARTGAVDLGRYLNGAVLGEAGAISGGDMGLEAAVVKLMHALALYPSAEEAEARAAYLLRDVAGERGDGAIHLDD